MNYYDNALDIYETAQGTLTLKKYRMCIYECCLSIELFLKSKLSLVEHEIPLESSHDIIAIYSCLNERFKSSKNLLNILKISRKYFNEARYPQMGIEIYTEQFAKDFLDYVRDIKNYIDNECHADLEDLKNSF